MSVPSKPETRMHCKTATGATVNFDSSSD